MSGDPWAGPLLLQLVLIFLSACYAAAEVALLSLNATKLHHDAEEGDPTAAKLLRITDAPARTLSTIQVCITLFGFLGSALAATQFAPRLAGAILSAGAGIDADVLNVLCVILITFLLSYLTLCLGTLVPKRLAMKNPEAIARRSLLLLEVSAVIFRPFVMLLNAATHGILRLCGIDPNAAEDEVTEDDIRMMVDIGGENGAIEEAEKEMIENIFEFNNSTAEEVMTHRTDVTSIWVDDTEDEILRTICDSGLSRFPVYNENMDDIIGILNTRDFLLNAQSDNPKSLRALLREAYFVPETVQADQLFRNMQVKKIHMAIVVDEYGGMSGIVTMEDLLEEIVGNIYDEFDKQTEAEIVRAGDNTWRISGSTPLKDVNDALDLSLPEDEDYDTLGGLIFSQFTTIPQDGSTPDLDCFGLHIHVEKLEDHRVETALVTKLATEDDHADDHPETLLDRLRSLQREMGECFFTMGNADLAAAASTDAFPISPASAACGVAVFRELGLIETHTAFGADGMARSIHVVETQDKVELTDSVRYREGLGEREVFHAFRDWAMKSDSATLHIRVSRPILPGDAAGDARER